MQSSHIDGEIVGALILTWAVRTARDASRAAVGREKYRCSLDPLGGGFRSCRASMPAGALLSASSQYTDRYGVPMMIIVKA